MGPNELRRQKSIFNGLIRQQVLYLDEKGRVYKKKNFQLYRYCQSCPPSLKEDKNWESHVSMDRLCITFGQQTCGRNSIKTFSLFSQPATSSTISSSVKPSLFLCSMRAYVITFCKSMCLKAQLGLWSNICSCIAKQRPRKNKLLFSCRGLKTVSKLSPSLTSLTLSSYPVS